MKFSRLCLVLVVLIFSSSCGLMSDSGGGKVKYPNAVQAAWREDFNQAEKSFNAKNYTDAEKRFKNYVQNYPYNELSDQANFRLGQIAMLKPDYAKAVAIFSLLIEKSPDPAVRSKARVKLGLCKYRQKDYAGALSAFSQADVKYLDEKEKVKMASFAIFSSYQLKEDLNRRAFYYAVLYDAYEPLSEQEIINRYGAGNETISKADVKARLKEWVDLSTPSEALDKRLYNYSGKYSRAYVSFKLGKSFYESKNNKRAQDYLREYLSKYPNQEYSAQATKMLAATGSSAPVAKAKSGGSTVAIGVILPLSGKYEQYGNNALKGMECAASVKPECQSGVGNVRLVVKDSMGDPQKVPGLISELVDKEQVVAIIGPLPSSEVDAAAKEAQAKNVTLLALAQKKEVTNLGNNIFRFSLTPATQMRSLLQFASKKGLKEFDILYPKNNYGEEFLEEFQRSASSFGVKLNSKASFAQNQADLSSSLNQLKLGSNNALFIPDSYLTVGKIAPLVAKAGKGDVVALGTNAWNDPSLPSRIGTYLKQAYYVDIYNRDSSVPIAQSFVREFQAAYNYAPSTLEAMGYDAVRILGQALGSKKVSRREDVRGALLQQKNYQGVTGLKGFKSDRESEVIPFILGVTGSGNQQVQ